MDIQEFKEKIMSKIDEVDRDIDGQMCIQWQLEGKREAFMDVKKLIAELIDKTYGEILQQTTDTEIARRARMVVECYGSQNVNGNDYYNVHQMEGAFFDGAKWILSQLKI